MIHDLSLYKHSGRLGNGPLLVPAVGILAALILAVVYAYADVYMPVAGYISFILTGLFAGGVGAAVSWAAVSAKCRSVGFVKLIALFIGGLAFYASWVAFEFVLIKRDLPASESVDPLKLFASPSATWGLAQLINESGWYTIRGATPKGVTLWILWILEGLIIVAGIWMVSTAGIQRRVFCERCSRWCREVKGKMLLAVSADEGIYRRLAEGDWNALAELPPIPAGASPHLRFDVQACDACVDTAAWEMHLVRHERTKEGKLEQKEHALTKRRLMTPQQIQDLGRLSLREPSAGSAAPAAS